jgi:hypothetical protein
VIVRAGAIVSYGVLKLGSQLMTLTGIRPNESSVRLREMELHRGNFPCFHLSPMQFLKLVALKGELFHAVHARKQPSCFACAISIGWPCDWCNAFVNVRRLPQVLTSGKQLL